MAGGLRQTQHSSLGVHLNQATPTVAHPAAPTFAEVASKFWSRSSAMMTPQGLGSICRVSLPRPSVGLAFSMDLSTLVMAA